MIDLLALDPEARRYAAAGAVALAYGAFCGLIAGRETLRRRAQRREAAALLSGTGEPVLLAYASQTGFAEELARATAKVLTAGGLPVTLRDLSAISAADLTGASRALFVVSTTGEGDAPDPARAFIRDVMSTTPALPDLRYGVLALGDSSYAQFCAFGRTLDTWLGRTGAAPLFDRVEIDNGDAAALRHWQGHLGTLTGQTDAPDWSRPAYATWRLAERRLLNPGSPGGEAWAIRLEPLETALDWSAGDLVEIGPRNAPAEVAAAIAALDLPASLDEDLATRRLPQDHQALAGQSPQSVLAALTVLPHREYSIASLPADGGIELIVRLAIRPDGQPGLGSGWLCHHAPLGATIDARVRTNRSFQAPEGVAPMILIGAGTGLAGLRAHLKARAMHGPGRTWLLFGERTAAHDYFHRDEIEAWRAAGVLERLDLAFSRDQDQRVYVQHRLIEAADAVRAWVADGATLMVCGSLEGMSREVHAALVEILGVEGLETLTDAGRYRRDVY